MTMKPSAIRLDAFTKGETITVSYVRESDDDERVTIQKGDQCVVFQFEALDWVREALDYVAGEVDGDG